MGYSPGGLLLVTNGHLVHRSTETNSCPDGWKIFSPRNKQDWETVASAVTINQLKSPYAIVDITSPNNGCGEGCTAHPMNSDNSIQGNYWKTRDGSKWWLRSTKYGEPNGDYTANCYMQLHSIDDPNAITFNDGNCNYHSKTYLCQEKSKVPTTCAAGSPASCSLTKLNTGDKKYSAGDLLLVTNGND